MQPMYKTKNFLNIQFNDKAENNPMVKPNYFIKDLDMPHALTLLCNLYTHLNECDFLIYGEVATALLDPENINITTHTFKKIDLLSSAQMRDTAKEKFLRTLQHLGIEYDYDRINGYYILLFKNTSNTDNQKDGYIIHLIDVENKKLYYPRKFITWSQHQFNNNQISYYHDLNGTTLPCVPKEYHETRSSNFSFKIIQPNQLQQLKSRLRLYVINDMNEFNLNQSNTEECISDNDTTSNSIA